MYVTTGKTGVGFMDLRINNSSLDRTDLPTEILSVRFLGRQAEHGSKFKGHVE